MMKLQVGNNPIIDCDSIKVNFTDMTSKEQNKGFLYLNPLEVKCVSAYFTEIEEGGQHR